MKQFEGNKVLLVQPNYQNRSNKKDKIDNIVGVHPPLGLLYIAATLQREGIETTIVDANYSRMKPGEVLENIGAFNVVGVSVLNQGYNFALELIESLPGHILKVCGGAHATGYAEAMLDGGFDVVVKGEGEETMLRICRGDAIDTIPGIAWRKNGKIFHSKPAARIDVNRLPFPARDLLPDGGTCWPYASAGTVRFPWAPILTSRGCPYTCYYCNKTIHGRAFRPRTPDDVVSEMVELVQRYGVREFDIVDDVFNLDTGRAIEICDLIIKNRLDISMRFGNGIRADKVTAELAKKLRLAGASYIAFGLESGSQRVLDAIPKNITLDKIREGVRLIQSEGIHTTGLFMLGLLEDTADSMLETIKFAKSLELDIAYFSIATPYPGTRFYERVKEKGKLLVENWDQFNHSYGKVLYEYPGAPSPLLVEKMFRKAYRYFYFRPTFIFKQALKKRTLNDWRVMARGGKDLYRNILLRGNKS